MYFCVVDHFMLTLIYRGYSGNKVKYMINLYYAFYEHILLKGYLFFDSYIVTKL